MKWLSSVVVCGCPHLSAAVVGPTSLAHGVFYTRRALLWLPEQPRPVALPRGKFFPRRGGRRSNRSQLQCLEASSFIQRGFLSGCRSNQSQLQYLEVSSFIRRGFLRGCRSNRSQLHLPGGEFLHPERGVLVGTGAHPGPAALIGTRKNQNDNMSRKRGAKERDISVGDLVLVKCRRGGSKFVLPFEKDPWVVSEVKGTMITATRGQETVTRNILFFKKMPFSDFPVTGEDPRKSSCGSDPGDSVGQDDDVIGPCSVTEGALSGGFISSSMQSPDGHLNVEPYTHRSVPESPYIRASTGCLILEPVTNRPVPAGPAVSSRGDGPYSLRPCPQCSTRLKGYVLD
ncbi:hypothetical protein NDU88_006260 [Pleurodeles waltl]|uniref:Uncharacterized protein n=1 Tax=Pleurodeles waltl TaxID=8319 RepID=A0AAV7MJC1_PLEWA|nr:hypothetical protein NDU88_006260 [Pleurodeles waltl]